MASSNRPKGRIAVSGERSLLSLFGVLNMIVDIIASAGIIQILVLNKNSVNGSNLGYTMVSIPIIMTCEALCLALLVAAIVYKKKNALPFSADFTLVIIGFILSLSPHIHFAGAEIVHSIDPYYAQAGNMSMSGCRSSQERAGV